MPASGFVCPKHNQFVEEGASCPWCVPVSAPAKSAAYGVPPGCILCSCGQFYFQPGCPVDMMEGVGPGGGFHNPLQCRDAAGAILRPVR